MISRNSQDYRFLFGGFFLTLVFCLVYVFLMGPHLFVIHGDSWIYTDIAKRIAFNHSLKMDLVFDLIYPPLYPALISLAYFFSDQTVIFYSILLLNILSYCSAFFPMYLLLTEYAGVKKIPALGISILLLINIWSLFYIFHIGSEALYCPLVVWFVFFLIDAHYLSSNRTLIFFALLMTGLPLTKTLGNIVYPGFLVYSVIRYWQTPSPRPVSLAIRPLIVLGISFFLFILYKRYQISVLPPGPDLTGGYLYTLKYPQLWTLSYWLNRTQYDLSWILIGTRTVAVPILLAIFLRNAGTLLKDPLLLFAGIIYGGTLVLVPLFTTPDEMGINHSRYYMPFAFTFIILLFKYYSLFTKQDAVVASFITIMAVGLIMPAFDSALPLFKQAFTKQLFIACILLASIFILYFWRQQFERVFLIMAFVYFVFWAWNFSFSLFEMTKSFDDEYGITKEIMKEKAKGDLPVFIDRKWRPSPHWMEFQDIMVNLPFVPDYLEVTDALENAPNQKKMAILTDRPLKNADKTIKGKNISLFVFKKGN